MSIVEEDEGAPEKPIPAPVRVTAPEYRGVTVDTNYIPSSHLLKHISGMSWTVDYYSQVIDKDNQVAGHQVSKSGIFEQYRLIKGMELKVQQDLNTAQNQESKAMTVTGTAIVYPFLIPNVGDMFLASIGDGKEGIFQITTSERPTYFKEACHLIEYIMIDYSSSGERLRDLNSKVVQTLQYVKDFHNHGQNPLLFEEDYVLLGELHNRYKEISEDYVRSFFSSEYGTLLMPGQGKPVYDHFLLEAVKKIYNTKDSPIIRQIRRLNVDGDQNLKTTQLWDVLMSLDSDRIPFICDQMGLVDSRTFAKDPMLSGIFHSGIRYVVYPKNPQKTIDYELKDKTPPLAMVDFVDDPGRAGKLIDVIKDTELLGLPYSAIDAPLIKPVLQDEHYVLSREFYDNVAGQSVLELSVRSLLDKKRVSVRALTTLCRSYHTWGGLERFYYVPILLILIKASIRSF